jgi:hypothetical protein
MRDVTPTLKETDTIRTERRLEVFGSSFSRSADLRRTPLSSRDAVRRILAPQKPLDEFVLPEIFEQRKISLTGESAIEPRALALP